MTVTLESDIVELNDDNFCISGTDLPVHQVLSDLAGGASLTDISEEYDIEESTITQILMDLSESFR
jgi:predicted transcriptional regulator